MIHRFDIRVYYEDTDLAGIVYYANYLRFIERARSEMIRELGIDQAAMKRELGLVFAVRRVEAEYLQPARYDDLIQVRTQPIKLTGARLVLDQTIWRADIELFQAKITLAALTETGTPARIPQALRSAMLD